jgi:hypothetical protein
MVALVLSLALATMIVRAWDRTAAGNPWQKNDSRPLFWWAFLAVLLAGLALVNFYYPLRRHFWGGGDEHIMFTPVASAFWSTGMDQFAGRPMTLLQVGLARLLTPDRIEGFLIVAFLLCVGNALLLAGILTRLFPEDRVIPVLGAVLFVINPCDASRFYVIWTTNCYWTALFFLQLAFLLFLESAPRGSRWMLAGACVSLLAAGLSSEAILPLACLAPMVLWLSGRGVGVGLTWGIAWYGSMTLLATRFLVHLAVDNVGYQGRMLAGSNLSMERLVDHAILQMSTMRAYFDFPLYARLHAILLATVLASFAIGLAASWMARRYLADSTRRASVLGLLSVIVVGCLVAAWNPPSDMRRITWFAGAVAGGIVAAGGVQLSRNGEIPSLWRVLFGATLALAAVACGVAPFVIVDGTMRTQFLAGPAQAALLACVIGLLSTWLPGHCRAAVALTCAGWLASAATVASWEKQEKARAEQAATFEKTVDVLDQVFALSPRFQRDTLLLFLVDSPQQSPCGNGAALECIVANLRRGALAVQATIDESAQPEGPLAQSATAAFFPHGIRVKSYLKGERLYRYEHVVVYQLHRSGAVTLLPEMSPSLLPANVRALGYAPLARMIPGPIEPLPFYRYATWMNPPHEVLDCRDGIRLGANWGPLGFRDGALLRWARDGAEIFVNPAGQAERTIRFVLASEHAADSALELIDDTDRVVAKAPARAGALEMALPMQFNRINRFRIRLAPASTDVPQCFRIARAGDPVPPHPNYHGATLRGDIGGAGVTLTGPWHAYETFGGDGFRWVENDAKLIVKPFRVPNMLRLVLEPGPCLKDGKGELTVRDKNDRLLTNLTLAQREAIHIPISAGGEVELRLHISNGGHPIPTDPRVLNFRVFRADLCDDD